MKILKIIGGLCAGAGVGICCGVAMNNLIAGILIGLGIGICYALVFTGSSKKD
ncbi:MAG: hypothetical protein IJF49_02265 [Clostridia bacterium]|nr:hypothetical protein [Clostridia bacterium]